MESQPLKHQTDIVDMPDSVLEKILFCANEDRGADNGLLLYMAVCKQWRQVVQSAQLKITLPRWFSVRFALKQVVLLSNLSALTLDGCLCAGISWAVFFERLGKECKQLKELSLTKVSPCLDQDDATSLIVNLTTLRALHVDGCIRAVRQLPLRALASLERLHILNANLETDALSDLTRMPNLHKLALSNVVNLHSLPPNVGSTLTNLEIIELRDMPDLQVLPPLGGLSQLRKLELSGFTPKLLHTLHFNDLPSLERLTLQSTAKSGTPPHAVSSLSALTKLQTLELRGLCPQNPGDLSHLSLLERLTVTLDTSRCPLQLSGLSSLTHLSIVDWNGLHPTFPEQQILPNLQDLPLLAHLELDWLYMYSNGGEQLRQFNNVPSQDVKISLLDEPSHFFLMRLESPAVTRLSIHSPWTTLIPAIFASGLTHLPNLSFLKLSGSQYTHLPPLPPLPSLQELHVAGFEWGNLSIHCNLPSLTSLLLKKLANVEVQSLDGAVTLRDLRIHNCVNLGDFKPMDQLQSLTSLEILSSTFYPFFPSLQGLASLKDLVIRNCNKNPFLLGLGALTRLSLVGQARLDFLRQVHSLTSLRTIEVRECPELISIQGLHGLQSLRSLDLSGCPLLERVPSLAGLSRLLFIDLRGCDTLTLPPDRDGLSEDLEVLLPAALA